MIHVFLQVDIFSYAMLLFELLTGERPFETLTSTSEINTAITKGERPALHDANGEPSFPAMVDLMYDCWVHSAGDRPSAQDVSTPTPHITHAHPHPTPTSPKKYPK